MKLTLYDRAYILLKNKCDSKGEINWGEIPETFSSLRIKHSEAHKIIKEMQGMGFIRESTKKKIKLKQFKKEGWLK